MAIKKERDFRQIEKFWGRLEKALEEGGLAK